MWRVIMSMTRELQGLRQALPSPVQRWSGRHIYMSRAKRAEKDLYLGINSV